MLDKNPLVEWLIEEQAGLTGRELAEQANIAYQTWSKIRSGKMNPSGDLIWRAMLAIASLRPNSECARIVTLIQGRRFKPEPIPIADQLSKLIDAADEQELETAMLQITAKIFGSRVKSPVR